MHCVPVHPTTLSYPSTPTDPNDSSSFLLVLGSYSYCVLMMATVMPCPADSLSQCSVPSSASHTLLPALQ